VQGSSVVSYNNPAGHCFSCAPFVPPSPWPATVHVPGSKRSQQAPLTKVAWAGDSSTGERRTPSSKRFILGVPAQLAGQRLLPPITLDTIGGKNEEPLPQGAANGLYAHRIGWSLWAYFFWSPGRAFTLLGSSQRPLQTESQVLTSFQEARLGLDQIVRDVNDAAIRPRACFQAGFPQFIYEVLHLPGAPAMPGPLSNRHGRGRKFATRRGDFDLIVETDPNPQDPSCAPACQVQ